MNNLKIQNQIFKLEKNIIEVIWDFISSFNSLKTQKRYKTVLVEFFELLEIKQLDELWNIHITEVKNIFDKFRANKSKFDEENKSHLLNPSSINNIAYIIKSFFNYLIDYYNYPKNPLSAFKPLKTKEHSSTHSLDRGELLDIIKQAKMDYLDILVKSDKVKKHLTKLRNYLIFGLLALSLRREEICNIKWDDLQEDSYFLIQQKWGSFKYIPIPSWLLDFLLKFRTEKTINNYTSHYIFTPFVNSYADNLNKPISADYIMEITQNMCTKLSIDKKITPHSFRKSFIEISLNKNENYNNIMNATGHKTSQMIRYYDFRDKVKNNAINGFGDMF